MTRAHVQSTKESLRDLTQKVSTIILSEKLPLSQVHRLELTRKMCAPEFQSWGMRVFITSRIQRSGQSWLVSNNPVSRLCESFSFTYNQSLVGCMHGCICGADERYTNVFMDQWTTWQAHYPVIGPGAFRFSGFQAHVSGWLQVSMYLA